MKFGVIVFPGSNCDHDAYHVISKHVGQPVDFIWHRDTDLSSYDAVIIPGGFSYGDYLRAGALERHGWNEDAKLEDYELYLRLSAEGEFAFDPQVLAAWRQHNGNTSRDLSLMMHQSEASQRRVAAMLGLCPSVFTELSGVGRLCAFVDTFD